MGQTIAERRAQRKFPRRQRSYHRRTADDPSGAIGGTGRPSRLDHDVATSSSSLVARRCTAGG